MADPLGQSVLQKSGVNLAGGSVSLSGATTSGLDQKVYMGPNSKNTIVGSGVLAPSYGPYTPYSGTPGTPYLGSDSLKVSDAKSLPLQWTDKQKSDLMAKGILYKIPGFNADMGMPELYDAWGNIIDQAVKFGWSPDEVMNSYKQKINAGTIKSADGDWLLDAATGEKIKYIGPRTKTTTEKRVDLSSPEDVKAITTQMLTELLGRAPSSEELAKYRGAINGYESANPALATTTQTLNDRGEVEATSTKTSGGTTDAARQMLITDAAKQGPEYGKFQGATTYYNAMMQMIGGG